MQHYFQNLYYCWILDFGVLTKLKTNKYNYNTYCYYTQLNVRSVLAILKCVSTHSFIFFLQPRPAIVQFNNSNAEKANHVLLTTLLSKLRLNIMQHVAKNWLKMQPIKNEKPSTHTILSEQYSLDLYFRIDGRIFRNCEKSIC